MEIKICFSMILQIKLIVNEFSIVFDKISVFMFLYHVNDLTFYQVNLLVMIWAINKRSYRLILSILHSLS